jgi:PPM family protein phosphatase
VTHSIRYAARTDRGLLRANNQDSVFAGDRLLIIADGMGGHAAGDVASRLVVAAFAPLDDLPLGTDMRRPLVDATREGNAAIADTVEENPEFDGMGTTLTALLFDGPTVALAHVGDSRAYLYRNGVLHQISHDDTFVQQLVDEGRITPEEAAHHPQRSLLLRALNGSDLDPTVTFREISPGDRFLICSDGLSDYVAAESIADTLAGDDLDQVADTLIQLALVAGGPDNVTVIVADVLDTGGTPTAGTAVVYEEDPEATGPMQPIHYTQRMPRVPLPPIPEEPGAPADYAQDDDADAEPDTDEPDDEEPDTDDEQETAASPASADRSPPPRQARWGLRLAIVAGVVVVLVAALLGTWIWTRSKYYVGADGAGEVAIYRGVGGSFLGVHFSSMQENSCGGQSGCSPILVSDLQAGSRAQVTAGIQAAGLDDARQVIKRLQLLPPCQPAVTPGTPGTSESSSASTESSSSAASSSAASSAPSSPTSGSRPSGSGPVTVTTLTTVTRSAGLAGQDTSTVVIPSSAQGSPARAPEQPASTTELSRTGEPLALAAPSTPRVPSSQAGQASAASRPSASRPSVTPSTPRSTVTVTSTVTATPPSSTGTLTTSSTPVPGVDCRVVR